MPGYRIGIKLPESDALTLEQKINKLMNLKIYIHEKGEFLFYRYIVFQQGGVLQ